MAKDFITPEQYQRGVGKIKKYVDDNKVIVPTNISEFTNDSKYINQIKVLPVEYDNDKMVNVQNLEPHSIYVVPSDVDYLDLGCMGESNRLVTVLATPNTEEFIYTGNKTDKYISFRFGARTHTIYFKTDTASSRIERYPYYLTPSNNEAYTPKNDYNPTTKKYVDGIANSLVKKDTNKYILITNDDTLVIKKNSITDIADATVTIDNLTGKFGTLVANNDGTYSYTLNTIMTDVETFTFKVNNVEQKLVIVPYKEMTYDNKNAGINYEGNWYEDTNDKYYKKSSHYTKGSDNSVSKLSFIFTGTAVRFVGMTSKALGQNHFRSQIFIVNPDGNVGNTSSYTSMIDNTITSTDDILYNTSVMYNNIDNALGYGKYKSVLTAGKGSSGYVDRIIIYNTIQKLNDSIESLYNQKEAAPTVLRTDIPNARFDPKELYDPATKYYVDKTVAEGKIAMCTDEEIDNMLNEVLGGDYSGN